MKTQWVYISDYYDIPISGWIRTEGKYYYFEVDDFEAAYPVWSVYDVTDKAVKIQHLKRIRKFRHLVGWHWDFRPGTERGYFSAETHPNWQEFYELPKPPELRSDIMVKVGNMDIGTYEVSVNTSP